eukprot:TRINITY_DN57182_c0_g1_i1.p2 TRINITY_DN57182_c0_g1~~TRINITY_DN57182_c0_g1_i1.p2  ORF type:complete len:135 (-),score=51.46 TRINITY_DN57182_c0_g1_i1:7-411(-)
MFFFFKQKTAYEMLRSLVGSEMCIRDRLWGEPATVVGMEADPRSSPLIWSFDGYGEAEQASFWLSAWVGLAMVLAVCLEIVSGRQDARLGQLHMYTSVCLLYTSDAADEEDSVDFGGRRTIKKKKMSKKEAEER